MFPFISRFSAIVLYPSVAQIICELNTQLANTIQADIGLTYRYDLYDQYDQFLTQFLTQFCSFLHHTADWTYFRQPTCMDANLVFLKENFINFNSCIVESQVKCS